MTAVRTIAVTQALDLRKSAEDLIVYCARVSNPANQDNVETGERLLRYCFEHKHWSVFESASMTLEIQTSRAIAAQLLRHRSFTFQEFSQRYQTVANQGFVHVDPRRQDPDNRQNSIDDLDAETWAWFYDARTYLEQQAMHAYLAALNKGVAKESARFLLPMTTRTTLYMTGSVRSWMHYLLARLDPTTQQEHREIAMLVSRELLTHFPICGSLVLGEVEAGLGSRKNDAPSSPTCPLVPCS